MPRSASQGGTERESFQRTNCQSITPFAVIAKGVFPYGFQLPYCPDSDGDGVADALDLCPGSDLRDTVWVGGCDSGVSNDIGGNQVNADGCSLADEVAEILSAAASGARNHGQFVSRTANALTALVNEGIITWAEHQAFMSCVSAADESQF